MDFFSFFFFMFSLPGGADSGIASFWTLVKKGIFLFSVPSLVVLLLILLKDARLLSPLPSHQTDQLFALFSAAVRRGKKRMIAKVVDVLLFRDG